MSGEDFDSEKLEDLLSRWHDWQYGSRVTRGFNNRSLVAGDYRVSGQNDDRDGVKYDEMDEARSRIVDHEVQEMLHPWRTAIYMLARNLCTGSDVWSSPRLPDEPEARAYVVSVARRQLAQRLTKAGVM